jgi:glucose/arabinose dehydrogenase
VTVLTARSLTVLTLAALAAAACAGDDADSTAPMDGSGSVTTPSSGAPTDGTTAPAQPNPSTTALPDTAGAPPDSEPSASATATPATTLPPTTVPAVPNRSVTPVVTVEAFAEFSQPVDLAVRPGDAALYVVEQGGTVVRSEGGRAAPVLDLGDLTASRGEQGLLGLAFHPTEPLAYVNYTAYDSGATVVAEYSVGADGTFDPASARTVLSLEQPYGNHNGGGLAFGPDGYLYIGTGDGGSGGDPERRASDPDDPLGKLLRIDPRPDPATGDPYVVPADNPFADGAAGAAEVWAIGLRNPWRFSFDTPTGDLWIADVGQNAIEEINRVSPVEGRAAGYAADFGWSAFEGTERFNDDVPEPAAHVLPVITYTHAQSGGCAVSGGVVYRGSAIPDLAGWYLYSDYCTGALWALDLAGGRNIVLAEGLGRVTAVRAGPDGEAYALAHNGQVFKVRREP